MAVWRISSHESAIMNRDIELGILRIINGPVSSGSSFRTE